MADRFELSYIYARVCGAQSRAWTGAKALDLLRLGKLSELWRAVFNDSPPSLPEVTLLKATEGRIVTESLADFAKLAEGLQNDEPFFLALRRKVEFARVKRVLLALRDNEKDCPACADPELPEGFNPSAYPEVGKMFGQGRYSWISKDSLLDLPAAENRLDRQYYEELWASLSTVPRSRRAGLRRLLLLEIELENVVWALRLTTYYGMDREGVKPLLVSLPRVDVTAAALDALGRKMDRRSDWDGWKYERLIRGIGEPWHLDVRTLETESRRFFYSRLRLALHMNPSSYTPLYCFYKMKEFEASVLLGVAEAVHLGARPEELEGFVLAGGRA
jgi:hypothetical protein